MAYLGPRIGPLCYVAVLFIMGANGSRQAPSSRAKAM